MKKFWLILFLSWVFTGSGSGEENYLLEYQPSSQIYLYHHYLQGRLESKKEASTVHLQFLRHWQLSESGQKKLLLREWGEKYQGSSFDLSQLGLPLPGERIERIIDRYGRVVKVMRYPEGHRYYLNLLVFPDHPVPVGKSWKYSYQVQFELYGRSVPGTCEILYTLDKVLDYKNQKSAKILIQARCQAGEQSTPQLDLSYQGKVFFDLTNKKEVDYLLKISWSKIEPEENQKEIANLELYSIFEQ